MENIRVSDLFDLKHTIASEYLKGFEYPWEALSGICDLIRSLGKGLDEAEYEKRAEDIWVHRSAKVVSTAVLVGPVIIGPGCFIGHCAFVRNGVLLGSDCTVGTCVEVKNSIIFDKVDLAHFNYVGDSILGFGSHLGGGAITSNLRLDEKNITIRSSQAIDTGLMKVGAMVGDKVQVGCNAILNPGAILGRSSVIYPLVSVKGVVAPDSVVKA